MDIALCTLDNITYTANTFNRTQDFATKKRFLVCTQCHGPAFFRDATRNGREACFGARPHGEGCTLATQERDGTPTGQGDVEDAIFAIGQRIVVDFNYGATVTDLGTQPAGGVADVGFGRTFTGEGTTVRDYTSRRMSSLLRNLIVAEDFRRSEQIIEVVGQGEYSARNFFINFSDITETHIDSYHGYWGMVPDARIDPHSGTLWFNSGGREDISILLDQRYIEATYQRFHIEDENEIAGAYILVFGELKRARETRKKFVEITDPSRFVLRLAR